MGEYLRFWGELTKRFDKIPRIFLSLSALVISYSSQNLEVTEDSKLRVQAQRADRASLTTQRSTAQSEWAQGQHGAERGATRCVETVDWRDRTVPRSQMSGPDPTGLSASYCEGLGGKAGSYSKLGYRPFGQKQRLSYRQTGPSGLISVQIGLAGQPANQLEMLWP